MEGWEDGIGICLIFVAHVPLKRRDDWGGVLHIPFRIMNFMTEFLKKR
jgi:hypothetical protein